jgi:hypothetical protein
MTAQIKADQLYHKIPYDNQKMHAQEHMADMQKHMTPSSSISHPYLMDFP